MKGVKILVRSTILVPEIKDVLCLTLYQLELLHAFVQMEQYFLIMEIVKKVISLSILYFQFWDNFISIRGNILHWLIFCKFSNRNFYSWSKTRMLCWRWLWLLRYLLQRKLCWRMPTFTMWFQRKMWKLPSLSTMYMFTRLHRKSKICM